MPKFRTQTDQLINWTLQTAYVCRRKMMNCIKSVWGNSTSADAACFFISSISTFASFKLPKHKYLSCKKRAIPQFENLLKYVSKYRWKELTKENRDCKFKNYINIAENSFEWMHVFTHQLLPRMFTKGNQYRGLWGNNVCNSDD